jgi:hypothetical protein
MTEQVCEDCGETEWDVEYSYDYEKYLCGRCFERFEEATTEQEEEGED